MRSIGFTLDAKTLLILAIIGHLLLFIRMAVLYAPGLSYQGPIGFDRVFYYAYVRSLVIDGDLDFSNEMAIRTPSIPSAVRYSDNGTPLNKYPIGMPLLALPFFGLAHVLVLSAASLGLTHLPADGYSAPYAMAFALAQLFWVLLGMILLYRTVAKYYNPKTAALAVITCWFGTNALYYTAADLMMSHAAALFSIAWCSYQSVRLRDSCTHWAAWLLVGISSAFVVLVRFQNAVYLLVPGVAALWALGRALQTLPTARALLRPLVSLIGFLLAYAPQLCVWKIVYGSWLAYTYENESFDWLHPHLVEALFDPNHGLAIWLPALVIGIAGCFLVAVRRRDPIALAAVVALLIHLYVSAAWWYWRLVPRTTFDMMFALSLGFAFTLHRLERRSALSAFAFSALLLLWNVPLVRNTEATQVLPLSEHWLAGLVRIFGLERLVSLG